MTPPPSKSRWRTGETSKRSLTAPTNRYRRKQPRSRKLLHCGAGNPFAETLIPVPRVVFPGISRRVHVRETTVVHPMSDSQIVEVRADQQGFHRRTCRPGNTWQHVTAGVARPRTNTLHVDFDNKMDMDINVDSKSPWCTAAQCMIGR